MERCGSFLHLHLGIDATGLPTEPSEAFPAQWASAARPKYQHAVLPSAVKSSIRYCTIVWSWLLNPWSERHHTAPNAMMTGGSEPQVPGAGRRAPKPPTSGKLKVKSLHN